MANLPLRRCMSVFAIVAILLLTLGRPAIIARATPPNPPITQTTRVSVASGGGDPNNSSSSAVVSSDGQFVVFVSYATNLVSPGTTTNRRHVYRRNMQDGTTSIVDIGQLGAEANADSFDPSVSADGRYIAFASDATNFVDGDENTLPDIYIRDMNSSTIKRVSISYDTIDPGGWSSKPAITVTPSKVYVTFASSATNLITTDTNGYADIFVRSLSLDLNTGSTSIISTTSGGVQANFYSENPVISSNGRYIVFDSLARNLADIGTTTSGRFHIYLHDRDTDNNGVFDEAGHTSTILVDKSVSNGESNNNSLNADISGDGLHVAFESSATNLVNGDTNSSEDIFVRNMSGSSTVLISVATNGVQADSNSYHATISHDGHYVAYNSDAENLVLGDSNGLNDIFVRDTVLNTTTLVSVSSTGLPADASDDYPSLTSDGVYLVFQTPATTLIVGDNNNKTDIYMVPASGVVPASPEHPNGQVRLSVDVVGPGFGSVTSGDGSISCGTACLAWVDVGASLTLTMHVNSPLAKFITWGGACSGTGATCTLTNIPATPQNVSAVFNTYIFLPLVMK